MKIFPISFLKSVFFSVVLISFMICTGLLFGDSIESNGEVVFSAKDMPEYKTVKPILEVKCMNCHSAETRYPLHYKIPFAKKMIDDDIANGREKMFFDENSDIRSNMNSAAFLRAVKRVIMNDSMPPLRYRVMHWDAWLSETEKKSLIDWAQAAQDFPQSGQATPAKKAEDSLVRQMLNEPIQPLPQKMDLDPSKVRLGNKLFHEKRLSADRTISCARCHDLGNGGADGLKVSPGVGGAMGNINSPTVFNSGFNFKQFWDGRANTLEEQIDGPLTNPKEMGISWEQATQEIASDPEYKELFKKVYAKEGITADTIKNAIATFERSLITPDAPFDRYLRGEENAITEDAKKGYQLFKANGCISCHQGVNVGGTLFEKLGTFGDYFKDRGNITQEDYGRYNVTQDERDRFKFKVPGLRNVEKTAPYFHDGAVETLEEAIRVMAKYQLGKNLSDEDVKNIAEFLKSLTGYYREAV